MITANFTSHCTRRKQNIPMEAQSLNQHFLKYITEETVTQNIHY